VQVESCLLRLVQSPFINHCTTLHSGTDAPAGVSSSQITQYLDRDLMEGSCVMVKRSLIPPHARQLDLLTYTNSASLRYLTFLWDHGL
jgi:hypothetical protein